MTAGRKRVILAVLSALVLLQGLAATLHFTRPAEQEEPVRFTELAEALPAPELAYRRLDGTSGRLAELRGRTVLVHFWATWCAPCRTELPELLELARELREPVVLAVAVRDDETGVRAFLGELPPRSVAIATNGNIDRLFGTDTLPDTYLVAPDGRMVGRFRGAHTWSGSETRAVLRRALFAIQERIDGR